MIGTQMTDGSESKLNIVNDHLDFPRISLTESTASGYRHIAAAVDDPPLPILPVYLFDSKEKQRLVAECKRLCDELAETDWVVDATVFKAVIHPPGRGEYLNQTDEDVHLADFDVAVLIEIETIPALQQLEENNTYLKLESTLEDAARSFHVISGTNEKRIGPVDHDSDGVFLFNYFFAEDIEQNLQVREYTSGWFQAETGLDNSTLLLPLDSDRSEYTVINHCRWDGLLDILPALLFKRTFRKYVLENFEANNVAPMPILYKLA